MHPIHVTSEIGKLKKVCLHRPGEEILNLHPDELENLLFDDIPFLEVAQQEHDAFADLMRNEGVEVVYLEKLVAEVFDKVPGTREEFLKQFLSEANIKGERVMQAAKERLESIKDNYEFVCKTMAGFTRAELELPALFKNSLESYLGSTEERDPLAVHPLPNLYFSRDPFATVGNGVCVNHMYAHTRNRETLYGEFIFRYHPEYKDVQRWYHRDAQYHIEGGDILNLSRTALAIGISQRTQAAAIDTIAKNIFWHSEGCEIEKIFAFDIPARRAFMHLDTVFTQIDYDKFTIHPAIMQTLRVLEITKGAKEDELKIEEHNGSLESILAYALGIDSVKLIQCAGGDPVAAAREQWNDGSNTLCIEPGKIVVYQRNNVTNKLLEKEGLDLLVMPSAEVSRGRGGPRCMSMPFIREDI